MPLHAYFSTAGSENWPTVYGAITHSEIFTTMVNSKTRGAVPASTLYMEYEYSVNSIKYTSSRISTGKPNIQDLVKKYPLNSEAVVYYNPNNHEIALLIPGDMSLLQDGWFLFGMILILMGLVTLVLNIYSSMKKK